MYENIAIFIGNIKTINVHHYFRFLLFTIESSFTEQNLQATH